MDNVAIKATNVTLTRKLRNLVAKCTEAAEKHISVDSDAVFCQFELEEDTKHHQKGEVFRAEMNLKVAGKKYRADAWGVDFPSAVDRVRSEIVRQLSADNKKAEKSLKRGGLEAKKILTGS